MVPRCWCSHCYCGYELEAWYFSDKFGNIRTCWIGCRCCNYRWNSIV